MDSKTYFSQLKKMKNRKKNTLDRLKKKGKFFLKETLKINQLVFFEIPFLNNLYIRSSFCGSMEPENLMALQEKKFQKNFNLNLEEFLLFLTIFIIFLQRKKKITRSKIISEFLLKTWLKFLENFNNLDSFINILFKFTVVRMRPLFTSFFFVLPEKKTHMKLNKNQVFDKNFHSFYFSRKSLGKFFDLLLGLEKKKKFFSLKIDYFKSIIRSFQNRNFRKFYLTGYTFLCFCLESEKIPRSIAFFLSRVCYNPLTLSFGLNSVYGLIYPEFFYKVLTQQLSQKGKLSLFSINQVLKRSLFEKPSIEFSRKARIESFRRIQTFKDYRNFTSFPFLEKNQKIQKNKFKKQSHDFHSKYKHNVWSSGFLFFTSRIVFTIKSGA